MGGLAAAHAVGQQQIHGAAYLEGIQLIAADILPLPGPQRRRHPIAHGLGAGGDGGTGTGQQVPQLGILLPGLVPDL